MDEPDSSLESRVEALERAVATLRRELAARPPTSPGSEKPHSAQPARVLIRSKPAVKKKPAAPTFLSSFMESMTMENVFRWAGIGLVLFAVAFLFKYAIDLGWLTPDVRTGLGLLLGIVLLALGWRVRSLRPAFGQVLQGGGIATFYITLFAAFQVLDLLDYPLAFGGMVIVTLLALALGIRQHDPALAVFGLIGGLATPFLLYTGEGDIAALVTYTCLLLAATTGVYFVYAWRSMLYTTVIGGWAVFFMAADGLPSDASLQIGARIALQLATVFAMVAFWAVPVIREIIQARRPNDTARPVSSASRPVTWIERFLRNAVHQLTIVTPLLALALSGNLWDISETSWGLIALAMAAFFGVLAWILAQQSSSNLAYTHALSGVALATVALFLLLDGDILFIAIAAEAAVLHVVASRLDDRLIRGSAHVLFVGLALTMLVRLGMNTEGPPALVNPNALSDLVVLALTVTASFSLARPNFRRVYRVVAYGALLVWFLRELVDVPSGHAYVTIAWSVCGLALLVAGLRREVRDLRIAGLGTLVMVVAKLFLVDLAELEALWRILLFLGVGAGFLIIGYFLPNLWRPLIEDDEEGPPADETGDS